MLQLCHQLAIALQAFVRWGAYLANLATILNCGIKVVRLGFPNFMGAMTSARFKNHSA